MKGRQCGVALISVLLVMSLALIVIGSVIRGQRLATRSTAQQLDYVQLRQWAMAAEGWAVDRLQAADPLPPTASVDAAPGRRDSVHQGQPWATARWPLALPDGQMTVVIEDLAGRLNINRWFVAGVQPPALQANGHRWFAWRGVQPLDPGAAETAGFFDPLADLTQLRLLPGVDNAWLQRMAPDLVVLPRVARVNINTAPLATWIALGLPEASARALLAKRPVEGFASLGSFLDDPLLRGHSLAAEELGMSSRWFRASIDVQSGEQRLRLLTDLQRDPTTRAVRVLQRRLLNPYEHEALP